MRTCPRDPPSRQDMETYRLGSTSSLGEADGAAITGAAGVNGTGAHPVRFRTMDLRSPNRSQSADGQLHTRPDASAYGAIGGDARVPNGGVGEAAAAGDRGGASAGGFGAAGGDRSSLNSFGSGHGALKVRCVVVCNKNWVGWVRWISACPYRLLVRFFPRRESFHLCAFRSHKMPHRSTVRTWMPN